MQMSEINLLIFLVQTIWSSKFCSNYLKKIVLQESTANEVLFERSHFRIFSQEPKVTNIKVHVFHHLFKKF